MLNKVFFFFLLILSLFTSCEYFHKENLGDPIAKINDTYLYKHQLEKIDFPEGVSKQDSISLVKDFIEQWAKEELLLQQALQNIPIDKQNEFDGLVETYRKELFISAYFNNYVQKKINKEINEQDIVAYYDLHKKGFLLKEPLYKFRYIMLPLNFKDLTATTKRFNRFNESDQEELNKMLAGFLKNNINEDDVWHTFDALLKEIPQLKDHSKKDFIKFKNVYRFKTDQGIYVFKLKELKKQGDIAPLSYVENDIKQIILNKRKLELQNKLETEITKDAKSTNQFSVFE